MVGQPDAGIKRHVEERARSEIVSVAGILGALRVIQKPAGVTADKVIQSWKSQLRCYVSTTVKFGSGLVQFSG